MPALLVILIALTALLAFCILLMGFRLRGMNCRLQSLTRGLENQNLEEVLNTYLDRVDGAVHRMDILEQAVAVLQAQLPGCLQRFSMVRYDAFEDVGGEQSFSVAMLDAQGDGILLTSVYSRMDNRVYAKSIQNGRASHTLSAEEEHALRTSVTR